MMLARAHRGSASAIATSAIQKVLSSAFQAIQRVPLGVRFQGSSTATSGGSDGSIVTGSKPLVQMFTKKECSLCVPVNEAILDAKVKLNHAFDYEKVDIEVDRTYYREYRYHIPVVHINGKEFARHRLDPDAFLKEMERIVQQQANEAAHSKG